MAIKRILGILIVPFGLAVVFIPYSLLIGWNLLSLVVFWFAIIPILASFLPLIISKNGRHIIESLAGLVIFYWLMVFMIYDHYQTDYFKLMMASLFINIFAVYVISLAEWPKMQTQ